MKFAQLAPGTYSVVAIVNWQDVEVKDYTVTINSADEIAITNVVGDKETIKLRPTDDIRASLVPDLLKSINLSSISKTVTYSRLKQSTLTVDPKSSSIAADIQVVRITPNIQPNAAPAKQWTVQICSAGGVVLVREH